MPISFLLLPFGKQLGHRRPHIPKLFLAFDSLPCKRKYNRSKNFVHVRSLNQFEIHTTAVIVQIALMPDTPAQQRH